MPDDASPNGANEKLAFVPELNAGELLLLRRVPLAGQQQGEALAGKGDETCKRESSR